MHAQLIESLYKEYFKQYESGELSTAFLLEKAAIALEEVDRQARKEINRIPFLLKPKDESHAT